jgi:hypothetical protein
MWNNKNDRLVFEAGNLTGAWKSVPERSLCSHRVTDLRYRNCVLGTDDSAAGSLTPFRVLARDAYLTELRATPATCRLTDDGVRVEWEPCLEHQARVSVTYDASRANTMDITIEVRGYGYYRDYELLFSHYTSAPFHAGCWVKSQGEPEAIMVEDNPVYHGLYNFFPRDLHAAQMFYDGRSERGRWCWQVAMGRFYGLPLVFSHNGEVEQILCGLPEDVCAVGLTYRGDANDGVASHKSMYLSLFGRDLNPGQTWRTRIRYMAGPRGMQEHAGICRTFSAACTEMERTFAIIP